MDLGLDGRAHVVTGGTSGLGRATAEVLVAEGARVVVVARTPEAVDGTVGALGERSIGLVGDLADPTLVTRAVAACREAFGRCDGGFVSYGGPPPGDAAGMDDDRLEVSVARGLVEPVRATRDLANGSDDGSSTVLLASSSVEQPIPGLAGSNLTRPGQWGFVATLADELAPQKRVNLLVPGRFATPRLEEVFVARAEQSGRSVDEERAADAAAIPLARVGDPAELGRIVAVLLSPVASYVTGSAWRVDGGLVRGL